jgi:L-ascorbate metabolism protein UlaG (beta-lactamase superfamily)
MPKLQYLSHSAFLIETVGKKLLIDPFFTGNPKAPVHARTIKPDYILLSHGHGDHLGDGVEMAKEHSATIIAPNELAVWCGQKGCKTHPMHIGGGWNFEFGRVKLTIAHHGSAAGPGEYGWECTGSPCGFLITSEGKTLYHAGDTGLFYDMKLIGEMNAIDLALLPIGDNFTMGIADAIKAVEFLRPKRAVPMHYNTFDMIKADPQVFVSGASKFASVSVMNIGEWLVY